MSAETGTIFAAGTPVCTRDARDIRMDCTPLDFDGVAYWTR